MPFRVLLDAQGNVLVDAQGNVLVTEISYAPGTEPSYLLLEDHYINNRLLKAGTKASEADFLPSDWTPTPNVDPLNSNAVNNFWMVGPQLGGLVRYNVNGVNPKPVTYWARVSNGVWKLTGLGANMPSRAGDPPNIPW